MHNSKLLNLFKILEKKELILLKKHLEAPVHNGKKSVLLLCQYLSKYYQNWQTRKLTKELAFDFVFPGEDYNAKRIRNVMSELSLRIEDFLVWRQTEKSQKARQKLLIEAFSERGNYALFKESLEKLKGDLETANVRDMEYYQEMGFIQHQLFFHPDTSKFSKDSDGIYCAMDALDNYFIIAKLKYACEILSRQKIFNKNTEISLLSEIENLPSDALLKQNPIIQLYLDLIFLLKNGHDNDKYHSLKNGFIESIDLMNRSEQMEILFRLINHTIRVSHSLDASYVREQFELYKIGLLHGLLIENERMTDTTFTNIVINATTLKEFNWAKKFIEHYQKYLEDTAREEAIQLSLGYYHFHKGEFSIADEQLRLNKFYNFRHALRARTLSVRVHFELFLRDKSLFTMLNYEILAMEKYLNRNTELSNSRKEAYLSLGRFLKKIAAVLVLYNPDKKLRERWLKELSEKEFIVARVWVGHKIQQL